MRNKNKLLVLSFIGLSLICTSCNKGYDNNSTKDEEKYEFKVTSKEDKVAIASSLSAIKGTSLNVSYFNNERVAYLELNDMVAFMNELDAVIAKEYDSSNVTSYEISQNDKIFTIKNKRFDTTCVINFNNRTLSFDDYHLFVNVMPGSKASGVHAFGGKATNAKDNFYNVSEQYIAGYKTTIDLSNYYIDLPYYENKGYIPFQSVCDIFLTGVGIPLTIINNTLYTAGAIKEGESLTPFGKEYYNSIVGLKELSEYENKYNYYETCLLLDNIYGLKSSHNITSFDKYFNDQGVKDKMLSSSKEFDQGLAQVLNVKISDFHTTFNYSSPWSGDFTPNSMMSMEGVIYCVMSQKIVQTRTSILGEKVEPLQIVGDTAFITFDSFIMPENLDAVYESSEITYTSTLIKNALNKINNDTSIKNVVLDLSCNGGGMADAALDVVNAMLGYCLITTRDTFTGSQMSAMYTVDSNLDGIIDEKDSLREGLNKYCLTSRASFSCGNLVPALLKEGGVKIIGETSGGGSCIVYQTSSANGTYFQISGNTEICTYKNGRLISVDDGVSPDYNITSYEKYYDRENLVTWIKSLY